MMESAGWYPDPSLRHEYRYWDGSVWTDTVADSSLVTVDPLIAVPASQPVAAPPFASPAGAAWQPPTATAEPARSHEPTWVVVLALMLFFPIGLALVWRKPWREGAKIGITVAVAMLLLGSAVASAVTLREQSKTSTTPPAVDRPAPPTAPPSTTLPPAVTTRTQAFLHAVHDQRAGSLGTEDDASLLALGRTGCRVSGTLTPSVMASSLHAGTPGVTLAQATYFVASIRLLCPGP
ncbi:MAG: hypothetical protein QOI44_2290 [Actinomycetota bacterium]|nr:hypothetical protein [Actinomycetota bacterium]